ncbi:NifB/NifX family molybdenum-iron cluster-binding protein [Myxococcota bacterium]|nr:NifB/NifX family molybdenum-iron cluster-binding protein [Myxococcota bacterium]MBU1533712.1 NifB/NifX family molybdenum-iron cluster-binding protein [Myxococcota bacterium]
MKIAVPVENGVLSAHFGHCEHFALITVNEAGVITEEESVDAPQHQPGLFPRWLSSLGADVIIAGGMGQMARQLFEQNNIEVVAGAPTQAPKTLVESFIKGTMGTNDAPCEGGHGHGGDCGGH